jgi:hypothetical protein
VRRLVSSTGKIVSAVAVPFVSYSRDGYLTVIVENMGINPAGFTVRRAPLPLSSCHD